MPYPSRNAGAQMQENDVNYHCSAAFYHFHIVGLPGVKHNPAIAAEWYRRAPWKRQSSTPTRPEIAHLRRN
jgi:hypothetical protein